MRLDDDADAGRRKQWTPVFDPVQQERRGIADGPRGIEATLAHAGAGGLAARQLATQWRSRLTGNTLSKNDDEKQPAAADDRARGTPGNERRSKHRVADDQNSGQGAQSALSKLKMIERRRATLSVRRDARD